MARLNIEDQFWMEIMPLVAKMGDQDKAIGQAVRFFRYAQTKHRKGESISPDEFEKNGFSEALLGVFAEAKPSGIEAKGSEKHFAWLSQKVEAGKRGGLAKSAAKTKSLIQNRPKRDRSRTEAKPSDTEPSLLSSLIPFKKEELNTSYLGETRVFADNLEIVNCQLVAKAAGEPVKYEISNPVGYFIGAYRKAFQVRYPNAQPDVRGKVQGQIKTFLKDCPMPEALNLIQVYCQMDGNRGWFKNKGHDFGTFLENLNPVRIALAQGFDPGKPAEPDWEKICGAR